MTVGYDPERLAALARQARAAIGSLGSLRSSDPSAVDAIASIHRLAATIEWGVLAVADDVIRAAPFTRSFGARAPDSIEPRRRRRAILSSPSPTATGTAADLFHDLDLDRILGRLATLGDDQLLFGEINAHLDRRDELLSHVDVDDPAWRSLAMALGTEFTRRARADHRFRERLIDAASTDPLLALIVAGSGLTSAVKVDVLANLLDPTVDIADRGDVTGRALHELMDAVGEDSLAALRAIGRPGLVEQLLDVPQQRPTADFDVARVADLIDAAFGDGRATDLEVSGDATVRALDALVELMNSAAGERGLPAPVSEAYTFGLVPLLPHLLPSFDREERFALHPESGPVLPLAATDHDAIRDLLGGLSRTPASLALLMSAIPVLAAALDPTEHGLFDAHDLAAFSVQLAIAADQEQREEYLHEERLEQRWHRAIDLLSETARLTQALPDAANAYVPVVADLAGSVVEQSIDPRPLSLDGVPRGIETLLVAGIVGTVLASRPADTSDADEWDHLADRFDDVTEAHVGAESLDEFEAEIFAIAGDVRDLVRRGTDAGEIDPELAHVLTALDTPGLARPPFQSQPDAVPDLAE